MAVIGARRLRELTAEDVQQALTAMARRYSSAAVAMGHGALTRAIRHAEARDLVARNVAMLVDIPKGRVERPSKSLSLEQASALLAVAQGTRMHAYIALCLGYRYPDRGGQGAAVGAHRVRRSGRQAAHAASMAVWRSVRAHGYMGLRS